MRARKLLICALVILLSAGAVAYHTNRKDCRAQSYAGTSAASMLTLETSANRVLYEKNADQKRPMASTTKIVTAITALENIADIDTVVKVPKEAVGVEGSSIYLQWNEQLTVKDLLHGLMLQSGNDCAVAIAVTTAGSIEKFADMMNATASKAGAKNSNFVNPHGLHHDRHYTTARDLALISSYAMKHEMFKQIVATKSYSAPWQGRDYNRVILNKNKILHTFEGGNGVKTGFTKKAGRCLVSSAERNGMQVISVVLNCGPMFEDCRNLMQSAFSQFSMTEVLTEHTVLTTVPVERSKQSSVNAGSLSTILYPLAADEREKIRYEFEPYSSLTAPVRYGQEAGKIKVYLSNQLLFEEILYTIEDVDPLSMRDYLEDLVEKWNE